MHFLKKINLWVVVWCLLASIASADSAAQSLDQLGADSPERATTRTLVMLPPYGQVALLDAVDFATVAADDIAISPAAASSVETILGRPARVLKAVPGEGATMTVRIGRQKNLRPGAAYVLTLDYPEDAPRSMLIINSGNESFRGFHTGLAVGDALRAKYVNSYVESLDLPLSGKWQTWSLLMRLHDRFPEAARSRGRERVRTLKPEDGFDVTITQFEAGNDPLSHGAAVGTLRLYEVINEDALALKLNLPPSDLPHRRIFWREEMADGLFESKNPEERGITNPIEWYRHKAELMRFLGINTFTRDLLEFGANQHWDSGAYGGNNWVYMNDEFKGLWEEVATLMGSYGFELFPYYEYSGSKGQQGLGFQRRAKPLTRDDAYTHTKWIESANADITDPDTYADFKKILDITVISLKDKAKFAGIWIRPRSQLPVGFGPATLQRFGDEANNGTVPTRAQLKGDQALYTRYIAWWNLKRRAFLVAMRDYLREKGVEDAVVLFTGEPGEPGTGFGSWTSYLVTDRPDLWGPVLASPPHSGSDGAKKWEIVTPKQVADSGLYLKGMLSPGLCWGGWENHHARPSDDPQNYTDQEGVMLAHAVNRLYTVASPKTFDAYRTQTGLAIVRHHALNENMIYDLNDKDKVGYNVADMERAGPFCMQAEAVAMANGDPTMIGYLVGGSFGRGFPQYVRDFNANYLALPALPSERLEGVSSDPDVVVRAIRTAKHGTYIAIVNTAPTPRAGVRVDLRSAKGTLKPLVGGGRIKVAGSTATLDLRPYQLVALKLD